MISSGAATSAVRIFMRLVTPARYVYGDLDGWTVVHGILQVGTATRAPLHTK